MDIEISDQPSSLGDFVGVLAVDAHHFSQHNDKQQAVLVHLLPEILRHATTRAHLDALWEGRVFRAPRGDGHVLGFDPKLVGEVIDRFFDALQAELRQRADRHRAEGMSLRLRASLHLGPVQTFDALLTDSPGGEVMVDSNRMVDAESVRALLDRSDPDVTFVASVVSKAVMEQVILAGHTRRKPSEFVEAPLRVVAKDYSGTGYLRVPVPSGDLLRAGLVVAESKSIEAAEEQAHPAMDSAHSNRTDGPTGNVVQAGGLDGDVTVVDESVRSDIDVNGDDNASAGRDLHQTTTKQDFSGTFTTSGDSNFGPSSGRRVTRDDVAGR